MSRTAKKKLDKSFLSELFLFKDLSDEKIELIINTIDIEVCEFESSEYIYAPDDFKSKVGFVISGECSVEREKSDGTSIPLNKLKVGDSFGILAVFSQSERFPTVVKASKNARIMFLSKDAVIYLIKTFPEISLALISFMSDRIEFLNKKIATFSADSVEEKFASFILSEVKRTNSMCFTLNLSKTAISLNSGRASIYRAIEALEKLELIKFENKKIYISDLEGLERITQ